MSLFTGKILKLQAENVKRLQAVEITPDGNVVVIAGENGNGKTSVLDSIMYALGGTDKFAKQPVRKGQDKAKIVLDLGDITVTRTITQSGGGSLTITNKEGLRYNSPQAILDKLVGALSFDPLEFSSQKPALQSETLRKIAGIDFTADDEEKRKLYDERTQVGRDVRSLEARLLALPAPRAGIADVELSSADIIEKQQAAIKTNAENQKKINALAEAKRDVESVENQIRVNQDQIGELNKQIEDLKKQVEARTQGDTKLKADLDSEKAKHKELTDAVAILKDVDLQQFTDQLSKIEETNKAIRQQVERKKLSTEHIAKGKEQENLTAQIEGVDARKLKKVKDAKFPIAGLSVDAAGEVLFKDLPLEQASSAEQLRVSVAIGLALNPKLRVLLIRNGSLLDTNSWKLLADLAEEADAQVWIEKVGTEGAVSVIIEDGMVKA